MERTRTLMTVHKFEVHKVSTSHHLSDTKSVIDKLPHMTMLYRQRRRHGQGTLVVSFAQVKV